MVARSGKGGGIRSRLGALPRPLGAHSGTRSARLHGGASLGASHAYLQVNESNLTAKSLHQRMGFVRHHGYRHAEVGH